MKNFVKSLKSSKPIKFNIDNGWSKKEETDRFARKMIDAIAHEGKCRNKKINELLLLLANDGRKKYYDRFKIINEKITGDLICLEKEVKKGSRRYTIWTLMCADKVKKKVLFEFYCMNDGKRKSEPTIRLPVEMTHHFVSSVMRRGGIRTAKHLGNVAGIFLPELLLPFHKITSITDRKIGEKFVVLRKDCGYIVCGVNKSNANKHGFSWDMITFVSCDMFKQEQIRLHDEVFKGRETEIVHLSLEKFFGKNANNIETQESDIERFLESLTEENVLETNLNPLSSIILTSPPINHLNHDTCRFV